VEEEEVVVDEVVVDSEEEDSEEVLEEEVVAEVLVVEDEEEDSVEDPAEEDSEVEEVEGSQGEEDSIDDIFNCNHNIKHQFVQINFYFYSDKNIIVINVLLCHTNHLKDWIPVMALPMIKVWMSEVPSYVLTDSRFMTCLMT